MKLPVTSTLATPTPLIVPNNALDSTATFAIPARNPPAIDMATSVDRMVPVHKLRCSPAVRDPGGGGINVARVATRLGADVKALYPRGGETGALLRRLIDAEGIASLAVHVAGETREDIELTLKMVRDLMPDDIGISVSYPLPGTPFYERVRHELGARANWLDSADLAMLYQGPFATEFYRQLHTVVHKDYRSRKTWQDLRGLIRNPANLRPDHLRRTAAMISAPPTANSNRFTPAFMCVSVWSVAFR